MIALTTSTSTARIHAAPRIMRAGAVPGAVLLLALAAAPACRDAAPAESTSRPAASSDGAPSSAAPPVASAPPAAPGPAASSAEAASHEHQAPHGGALIELGEEFAHIELVLGSATGTLTAYVLDGEAENAVRLTQPTLDLTVTPPGGAPVTLQLAAVANELTGERVGDSSQFAATSPALVQAARFDGLVTSVAVRGQQFRRVAFRYPEGSEPE